VSTTLVVTDLPSSILVVEDIEEGTTIAIDAPASSVLEVIDSGMQGATGASGAGGSPTRVEFTNSATWIHAHNLGRVPFVLAYLSDGRPLLADLTVTDINLTVVHASAQSGFVLFF
jgi:hypothetical protein